MGERTLGVKRGFLLPVAVVVVAAAGVAGYKAVAGSPRSAYREKNPDYAAFCDYLFASAASPEKVCRMLDAADGREDGVFGDLRGDAPNRVKTILSEPDQKALGEALAFQRYALSETSEAWRNAAANAGVHKPMELRQFYQLADKTGHDGALAGTLPPMKNETFSLVNAAWQEGLGR